MIKPKKVFSFLFVALFFIVYSCKNGEKPIPIKKISIDSQLFRFDELLSQKDAISLDQWENVQQEQPYFFSIFNEQILGDTTSNNSQSLILVNQFKNYFDSTGVNQLVHDEYQNLPEFDQFVDVQKRLKVLVPRFEPLDVITEISGFNYKTMLLDDAVAAGLEFYLDDQIDYSEIPTGVFEYQLHRFNREYLVPDLTTSTVDDLYPDQGEFNTFLKRILYEGKKLYLKQRIQPNVDGSIIIGMREEDFKWCQDNELEIWQYFIAEELLFSNDLTRYKTYVMDGPFSAGMPEGAPANTGNFIGWQIINSYMKNNSVTVDELFSTTDESKILKDSRYRP